jgi:adhesin transport system outer membrane protein
MAIKNRFRKVTYSSLLVGLMFSVNLNATSLRDSIEQTINTNPDIMAEHYNKKVNRASIEVEKGDYYPTLDFTTYLEDSRTEKDFKDNTPDDNLNKEGWNANLKLEQILYDGGKTPSEIEQSRHKYYNIKYTSNAAVENIILEVTNTYLDLVLNQSLKAFGEFKVVAHEYYLKLAQEKEDISGEILDRLQVQSKIRSLIDSNLNQEVKNQKAYSTYEKLTGKKISGNICRPILDEKLIPKTLDEAIDIAIKSDYRIRAQYELIQEQKATIAVQEAKFRPDLKLTVEAEWDKDLKLSENGQQDQYKAQLKSTWNFFEGGKDKTTLEKEKIAMLEQRKILDAIKSEVEDEIKGTYNTYFQMKKRIENLKEFVDINNQIVDVYNEQIKEGSRTFMDLLSAETEVFRTRILLEEEEINRYREYFSMMKSLNKLSDSVLAQKNQRCKKFDMNSILPNYEEQYKNNEADLEENLELEAEALGLEE